jgi:hypothetical protein
MLVGVARPPGGPISACPKLRRALWVALSAACDPRTPAPRDTTGGDDTDAGECLVQQVLAGVRQADVAVDGDGRAAIAYVEGDLGSVVLLRCRDASCWRSETTVLQACGPAGCEHPSVVIDGEGRPLVAFIDHDVGVVRFARCVDEACASATVHSLSGESGWGTDIVLDPDGLPVVAWGGLQLARCADPACEASEVWILEDRDGGLPALALDSGGRPRIATVTYDGLDGHHAWNDCRVDLYACDDAACGSVANTRFGDCPDPTASPIDLVLGAGGLPLVALGRDLVVCADDTCAVRQVVTLEVGFTTAVALALAPGGLPVVAYALADQPLEGAALRVAHCRDAACAGADVVPWATEMAEVAQASLAIAPDGAGALATTAKGDPWPLDLSAWRTGECLP